MTEKDAGVAPNRTDVAPVKSYPVTVTAFPPPAGPLVGWRPVTTGQVGGDARTASSRGADGVPHPVARS